MPGTQRDPPWFVEYSQNSLPDPRLSLLHLSRGREGEGEREEERERGKRSDGYQHNLTMLGREGARSHKTQWFLSIKKQLVCS